ncbi:MAG: BUG/TctC family periplasmic protein, partial [uncultured Acetobacteraceae bacterium]
APPRRARRRLRRHMRPAARPLRPRPGWRVVPRPPHSLRRAFPGRRRHRRLVADGGRCHGGRAGPARGHREPERRRRHGRFGGGSQGRARRPHAAVHHLPLHPEPGGVPPLALPAAGGFCPGRQARHHAAALLHPAGDPGADPARIRRFRARQGPLVRLLRRRIDGARDGAAPVRPRQARDDAHRLSRRGADADRHPGRADRLRLPQHDGRGRLHPRRAVAGSGLLGAQRHPFAAAGADLRFAGLPGGLRNGGLHRVVRAIAGAGGGAGEAGGGVRRRGRQRGLPAALAGDRHHPGLVGAGGVPGRDRPPAQGVERLGGGDEPDGGRV